MGVGSNRQDDPAVLPVSPEDYQHIGGVLGRAFAQDPLWSMLMPDLRLRSLMFTGTVKLMIAAGGVVETTDDLAAAALWTPPGRRIGMRAVARSGLAPARWMVRTPRRSLRRMMTLHRQVEEHRKRLMREPHWGLEVLGVDPDRHGGGHGTSLVAAGIERADSDHAPTYVDTSAERNVGFYERFGFEVVDKTAVTDLELPFWMMVRNPGS